MNVPASEDEPLPTFVQVFDLLGVRRAHTTEASALALHSIITKGLPFSSLERVAKRVGLPVTGAAKVLGLTERTVQRRKEQGQRFTQPESEKVARLARVMVRATDVFGDAERASTWLNRSNRSLGCEPVSLLDTDVGAEAVLDVLGRMEYGVIG